MKGESIFLIILFGLGILWAIFSKKQKEINSTNEYGNWMESMPRWGKISMVIIICTLFYWFWFVL